MCFIYLSIYLFILFFYEYIYVYIFDSSSEMIYYSLDYLNRVHLDEDNEHIMFCPEEYPGLPQEADINCKNGSLTIEGMKWKKNICNYEIK